MSIIPGTTPTLTLSLDASIANCTAAEFCFVCENVRILRDLQEMQISEDGTEVSVQLTQSETISLPDNRMVKMQLRVMIDGAVLATDVLAVPTKELLHREVL